MPAEEYFNLYKKCVDVQSIQFTLDDLKRFTLSSNIKIIIKRNCIAILGLTDNEIEIYFIGVEEKFRGKGYGKKIVEHLEDYASKNRFKIIILNARNHAIEFYQNSDLIFFLTEIYYQPLL